jgi:demethylmenaquinone methyltransferase / 2-methoxy-6-polyprenyl-1,4-benzoquinol methylase
MPSGSEDMKGKLMDQFEHTDYGYERVTLDEKRKRVLNLFDAVASNYDLMNDFMSFGAHRFWKQYAAYISGLKQGDKVLDVAGGTGDMACLFATRVGESGTVTICDLSYKMISMGRNRLLDSGLYKSIRYVQGDAENLPFTDNTFDLICIAFGLRNVADKSKALKSMYSKLKYGSSILIIEFSRVVSSRARDIYQKYSDYYIPLLGKVIARDENSYRYLVESIRLHPDQENLKTMIEQAGFTRVNYINLTGGMVAIHRAYKL